MSDPPRTDKPVIGIVGGIGAGKSTAAQAFADLGCALIDADAIGHELLADPDVLRQVRRRWGQAVGADGRVDRRVLAAVVFADAAELEALNRILHPRIRRELARRIARALADADTQGVVVDAAVLFEAGWDDLCTHRVFVAASDEQRSRRVARQRGWDHAVWQQREKTQISLDTKAAKSDYTVDNRSGASRLRKQIRQLLHQIRFGVD